MRHVTLAENANPTVLAAQVNCERNATTGEVDKSLPLTARRRNAFYVRVSRENEHLIGSAKIGVLPNQTRSVVRRHMPVGCVNPYSKLMLREGTSVPA